MAKAKKGLALLLAVLVSACGSVPKTPMDQEPLAMVPEEGPGQIYLTCERVPDVVKVFNRIADEFRRHRLRIAIVWQTPNPPTNEQLAVFPGRYIRQYHDPNQAVPSTKGSLMVYGELVPLDNAVALRVALAKATLR